MHAGNHGNALHVDILDRWQKPGDITNVPRLDYSKRTPFGAASDRWLVDASFFNIKAVTLSYTLPASLTEAANMAKARVWISGENFYLINSRVGLDPRRHLPVPLITSTLRRGYLLQV